MALADLVCPAIERSGLERRDILKGAAMGLALPFATRLATPARAAGRTLNIASYGGSYGDALKKAWLDPFEKETGIKVNLGVNASLYAMRWADDAERRTGRPSRVAQLIERVVDR